MISKPSFVVENSRWKIDSLVLWVPMRCLVALLYSFLKSAEKSECSWNNRGWWQLLTSVCEYRTDVTMYVTSFFLNNYLNVPICTLRLRLNSHKSTELKCFFYNARNKRKKLRQGHHHNGDQDTRGPHIFLQSAVADFVISRKLQDCSCHRFTATQYKFYMRCNSRSSNSGLL